MAGYNNTLRTLLRCRATMYAGTYAPRSGGRFPDTARPVVWSANCSERPTVGSPHLMHLGRSDLVAAVGLPALSGCASWPDEAGLVGEDYGLGAVAEAELHQHVGYVGLDGACSEYELGSDLGV